MKDGKGSPIIVLPILILLLVAGLAAGIGIAIGANDNGDDSSATTTITAAQLGSLCTDQVGARPTGAVAQATWLAAVSDCIEGHLITAYGSREDAVADGYDGVQVSATFAAQPVIVVRWVDGAPTAVAGWVARYPVGLVTVTS